MEKPDPDPYSSLSQTNITGIIIVTVAILAIAAIAYFFLKKRRLGKPILFSMPTILKGSTTIADLCRRFGIAESYFEPMQGDATTISGLLTEMEGHLPDKGSIFEFDGFVFEITDADENEVKTVKVRHSTNKKR